MYSISIQKSGEKDLERIPTTVLSKIVKAIDSLKKDPRPPGVKKLKGSTENLYRIRSGDYRIVYSIEDEIRVVNIRRIRHRKDIYRDL